MANNREISQFAGLVTVADSTNNVSLGNTFFLTGNARLGVGTDSVSRKVIFSDTTSAVLTINSTSTDGTSFRIQQSKVDKMFMGLAGDFITSQTSNVTDCAVRSEGALLFATGGGTERARIDSNGNLSIGATNVLGKFSIQAGTNASLSVRDSTAVTGSNGIILENWTSPLAPGGGTIPFLIRASQFQFGTDTGGSFVERMRIGSGGEVLIGTDSTASGGSGGNFAFLAQCFINEENRPIAAFRRADLISAQFFGSNGGDGNAANCIMRIRGHSAGNRSINAGGSVNATGADYAEYMTKAGEFVIAKGDVCGVTPDGKLTNIFADAISFVVKSTNPSYIGNDTWGIDIENEEEREAEREKVDRIAFAGQVPVNVTSATSGQYIVPIETEDGGIEGVAKDEADLTLAEYMRAVGKVIAIEDDGRARIIVKVA